MSLLPAALLLLAALARAQCGADKLAAVDREGRFERCVVKPVLDREWCPAGLALKPEASAAVLCVPTPAPDKTRCPRGYSLLRGPQEACVYWQAGPLEAFDIAAGGFIVVPDPEETIPVHDPRIPAVERPPRPAPEETPESLERRAFSASTAREGFLALQRALELDLERHRDPDWRQARYRAYLFARLAVEAQDHAVRHKNADAAKGAELAVRLAFRFSVHTAAPYFARMLVSPCGHILDAEPLPDSCAHPLGRLDRALAFDPASKPFKRWRAALVARAAGKPVPPPDDLQGLRAALRDSYERGRKRAP